MRNSRIRPGIETSSANCFSLRIEAAGDPAAERAGGPGDDGHQATFTTR